MRNLTIKREKSFVGCISKMKVYVEDSTSSEIVINNISYRKVGELKNGEEKTFSISENECNVAVIAGAASKNFCNEIYKIPAGESDVFLSGQNKFNLVTGNAFRFNGIADSEILQNRKKGFNKGLIVLCFSIAIGAIVGFSIANLLFKSPKIETKQFSKDGMTITLTNQFRELSQEGFNVCYDSNDIAVLMLKESFFLK